ncbi:unnamed protein product [Macrosiphum euphorbiae]|uniref:Uncharacterized protein n=1 Tax=Macrosiphum euphorbiae TaxID=13131 RepID=A0AAV0X3M7_9HEMI|nr:unnamed protein product [Macrosiphum euphorbiae]
MADYTLHRVGTTTSNFDLEINDGIRNEALVLIEDMCVLMCGSMLTTLGMPAPNRSTHDALNRELHREKDYDRDEPVERVRTNVYWICRPAVEGFSTSRRPRTGTLNPQPWALLGSRRMC